MARLGRDGIHASGGVFRIDDNVIVTRSTSQFVKGQPAQQRNTLAQGKITELTNDGAVIGGVKLSKRKIEQSGVTVTKT